MKKYLIFGLAFLILGCNFYDTVDNSNSDNYGDYTLYSTIQTEGIIYDFKIYNDYLYIADGLSGVKIYDVSDMNHPEFIYSLSTFDTAYSINKNLDNLYIADDTGGLRIVKLDNFIFPEETSYYQTEHAFSLDRFDDKLVIADGAGGLKYFDVSNNYSPSLLDEQNIAGIIFLCAKFFSRNKIIAGTNAGLYLYTIEDNELHLQTSIFSDYVYDFVVNNDYLYSGSGNELIEYKIENNSLIEKDRLVFFDQIRNISFQTNKLYVATSSDGLNIIDVSNSLMYNIDNIPTDNKLNEILVENNRIYLGNNHGMVKIFHINNQ